MGEYVWKKRNEMESSSDKIKTVIVIKNVPH